MGSQANRCMTKPTLSYFTDSLVNIIWKYDHDDGKLSNRRVFIDAVQLGYAKDTYCDGMAIDDQGGVWSARWIQSRVTHSEC